MYYVVQIVFHILS